MFIKDNVYRFTSKAARETFAALSKENAEVASVIGDGAFRADSVNARIGNVFGFTRLSDGEFFCVDEPPFKDWGVLLLKYEREFFTCVQRDVEGEDYLDTAKPVSYDDYLKLEGIIGHLLSLVDVECDVPKDLQKELEELGLL